MTRISLLTFTLLILFTQLCSASSIEGHWEGMLNFKGKELNLQLDIKIDGIDVSGFSHLSYPSKKASASFEFQGYIDGKILFITEQEQLSSLDVEWCLKEMKLSYTTEDNFAYLNGTWRSQKCGQGYISLKRKKIKNIPNNKDDILNPGIKGSYSGHLSQSDREYGFYFQMNFYPTDAHSGRGISQIVSEDAGGSAYHLFEYHIDTIESLLHFEERKVIFKTIPKWIWCLKKGSLRLENSKDLRTLSGDWAGDLETGKGPCAPGSLEVEQFPEEELELEDIPYEKLTKRSANTTRYHETEATRLSLRIWDNNVVDGDVVSLYLNDEVILENCRISKYKRPISIELKNKNNYLILHAENLGRVSPNTTAIEISDNDRQKIFVLSSDFKHSGAIVIKRIDDF